MFEEVSAAINGMPVGSLSDEELLEAIVAVQRTVNQLHGLQLRCVMEFAQDRSAPAEPSVPGGETARYGDISEFAAAEIAVALGLTRRGGDRLLSTAYALEQLPRTAVALGRGEVDLRRVQVLIDGIYDLPEQARHAVEAHVLPDAAAQTVPQLAAAVRRAALRYARSTVAERQATIHDERAVWTEHRGDGCSRFIAEGPTHDVLRIATAVHSVARTLDPGSGQVEQRRFDALNQLADTILDDPNLPKTRFGAPGLVLLADVAALARLRDAQHTEPEVESEATADAVAAGPLAELLGDGAILDGLARQLLAAPHTTVIPADPTARWTCEHTGGYRISDKLARHLAGVHRYCTFPGCRIPANLCDWDHVTPWPDGPTCACNIIPQCRFHHRLKTHTRWQVTLHPDRRVEWTAPTGHTHIIYPADDEAA